MLTDLSKADYKYIGERGLPEDYPTPHMGADGLFYIQRNQNYNTVVYEANRLANGRINPQEPLNVFWIRYQDQGERRELNLIQKQLAYGYRHETINDDLIEISVVSYTAKKIFIDNNTPLGTMALTHINGKMAYLTNVYVYALEMGLFPDVKYIELYGLDLDGHLPTYEKFLL